MVASERAKQLELSINFVQADAADLKYVGNKGVRSRLLFLQFLRLDRRLALGLQ